MTWTFLPCDEGFSPFWVGLLHVGGGQTKGRYVSVLWAAAFTPGIGGGLILPV